MRKLAGIGILVLLAGVATAQETVIHTGVQSDGLLGAPENPVFNEVLNGGYPLGTISFSGTLTKVATGDLASESRLQLTHPQGIARLIQFTTLSYSGGVVNFTGSTALGFGIDPAGIWNFRYYQSYNDPGVDCTVDVTYNFTVAGTPPPAPTAEDLGYIVNQTKIGNLAAGEVKWYKLVVGEPVLDALDKFLDIDTEGSALTPNNDTEIGLYDAYGNLVTTDDDDGSGLLSQLTYGDTTFPRPAVGNGQIYNGRDGQLFAGVYYLAVAGYNSTFNATNFSVTSTSTNTGEYHLNFNTNIIPEPASLILLGLVALLRRR